MRKMILFAVLLGSQICFGGDGPTTDFLSLEVGVLRHTGEHSGYGAPLSKVVNKFNDAGSTVEWKKVSSEDWIMHVSKVDPATDKKIKLTFALKKVNKLASIYRFLMNGEEQPAYTMAMLVDQVIHPVIGNVGSSEDKKPTKLTKQNFSGKYKCSGGEQLNVESQGSKIKISYLNACGDSKRSYPDLIGKLDCGSEGCDAQFKSGKCKLFLALNKNEIYVSNQHPQKLDGYSACCNEDYAIDSTCQKE